MLNAGHETSTNMLSHGVHEMLRHPDQIAALRANPALIDTCVEEVLRYQAPIQINNRRSLNPTRIGDADVPAGTTVHLMLGAGNRDPAQFPDPDRFDIARRPNRHLSFGLGIHICAGNALARIEAKIAFLEAGGPKRDRKALDPDGDGYACGWDPAPYRRAVQN